MLPRIATAVTASSKTREIAAGKVAAMPSRMPRPIKGAIVRRLSSRTSTTEASVKHAAPRQEKPSVRPVKSADITGALAALSISTVKKANPPATSSHGTKPRAPSARPTPSQLIVGRRRPQSAVGISSTAKASAAAKIAERHELIRGRTSSISSSVSTSRSVSRELPEPVKLRPRRHIRYQRPVQLGPQGTVTEYRLVDYVNISDHILYSESRIPSMPTGSRRSTQSKSERHITPSSCRIQLQLTREVSQRGLEPYSPGWACKHLIPAYRDAPAADMAKYYDRDLHVQICPYHHDDIDKTTGTHVLPRLWVSTPAEADTVDINRPCRVRFSKGLISSTSYYTVTPWTAVESSHSFCGNKLSHLSPEYLVQTKRNTELNRDPTMDNDSELQAVKTKFGTRYERRRTPVKSDPVDFDWTSQKAKIDALLAAFEESSDSFSESDFF